ncbi:MULTISPECIES: CHAT domain-containing tetratricopeptide repeat protein [Kamptonema]|uniref:CHAT domain-containing tetratricopeptide repeat protein n=1 Tax=Kamptonema TaxID=1501433 RepID=UPI0001DACD56|nr:MULTISPECIES: CHAT domain-containing tetratricopeptide repeat protein [Kamptonema]CBN55058.1 putative Tetratricopeptide TPR_2 repeat protein [Kamptonema sp. PCC 6506]
MRSRTVLLVLLFIAGLTGLLFYDFHNQQIPHQKKSEQTPSPHPSKIPVLIPTQISEGCIENTEQKKTSSPITSQKYTLKEAENYLLKGIQYTKKYQYDDALKSFDIALKVYQTEKNFEKQAITLGNIGSVYYETANYKQAINCHNKRRIIAASKKINKKEETDALSSLGNAYYAMGNYSKARIYYKRSLKISLGIIDKHSEAIALGGLGSVYHSVGNYGQAIKHHEKRLNIIKEVLKNQRQLTEEDRKEFLKLKGAALGSLGNAHHMQKKYERAMVYYEEHFKTAVDGQDKREEAIALGELGSAYHGYWKRSNFKNNGDLEKAIKLYEDRLRIAKGIADSRLIASSHGGLGYIYYSIASRNSSLEFYDKTITSTGEHLNTSKSIQDKPGEGNALNLLGVSYFQISNLLKKEQKFAEAQENLDKAIQNLKTAISVRESLREGLTETEKVFIFDTQQTAYLNLQQVYISKGESKGKSEGEGEYELALEVAERGRARAFVDVLAKQLKINREVSTTLNFKDIKRIAQEQQATLVVYSYIAKENNISGHDSQIYIWIVRPNQEKVSFEKVPLNSWEKTLNTVRKNLPIGDRPVGIIGNSLIRYIVRGTKKDINEIDSNKQISQEDIEKILSEYYKVLIEPKKGHKLLSKEDKKVIFIPQGTLFEIPFAALYDTTEKQYLIEKYSILTAPSIQALDMLRERQQQREFSTKFLRDEDWLILGIEDAKPNKFCSQDVTLNKLPGAEQEAKDIASVLFQGKAMEDKTETAVRQKMLQARIIHLATHGLLDNCEEEAEVPGAIALNASGNDDGWLTASEISQMKLQAELIVLSACDTALGRLTADGVIGLSRSAISAGASSAIVSLWNVDDYSTAFLMTEFYRQLKEQSKSGKLDKAEALRQAMLNTKNYVDKDTKKKIYSEPYQWSAFTLVGEATTQLEKRQQ